MKENNTNYTGLIEFLWDWKKPILIITILGAVTSIVVSLFMTDYYRAVAVVAPVKSNAVMYSTNLMATPGESGDDADALRLLMILESPEIRDSLVIKYELYDHYKIDSGEDHAHYKFQKEFNNNISFERTRENAIEVVVLDRDPEIAMNMANDIVRLADTVVNRMVRQRAVPALHAVQEEVALILEQLGDYQDKLKALRDSGVVGEEERKDLYTNYLVAKSQGFAEIATELKVRIDANKKYGSDFDLYSDLAEAFSMRYAEMLDVNDQYKQFVKPFPQSIRRNMAELPDRKHLPKRSIIVILSTLGAFLFGCVGVILWERLKQLRSR